MYPRAIFEGFKHGLKSNNTAAEGGMPYCPWTQSDQFSSWMNGFFGARKMVEYRMERLAGDPAYMAYYIIDYTDPGFETRAIVALCFQEAGYTRAQFRSHLDAVPVTCSLCGHKMVMQAFTKEKRDSLRSSYRIIAQCQNCDFVEEY